MIASKKNIAELTKYNKNMRSITYFLTALSLLACRAATEDFHSCPVFSSASTVPNVLGTVAFTFATWRPVKGSSGDV